MLKVLFAAGEAQPLIATGGLGEVAGSLPPALNRLGCDTRVVLPAYRAARERAGVLQPAAEFTVPGYGEPVRVLRGTLPGNGTTAYLVDVPGLFDRPGSPYTDAQGNDWPDNALRFAVFGRAVERMALDRAGLGWRPDVLHGHDWQTGIACALLAAAPRRPALIFTIHNLAYQGIFDRPTFDALALPGSLWTMEGLEFYGNFAFIKGGLAYADLITTVSPTYAREVLTAEFGCGLEGLLRWRAGALVGILNGVDYTAWDPATDQHIACTYDSDRLAAKAANRLALQRRLRLHEDADGPLLALVARLVPQKGIDLLLGAAEELLEAGAQIAVLGSGQPALEQAVTARAHARPGHFAAVIGYDQPLSHLMEAGADMFVMPSRFEPCGLNQIYSLRYGTVPLVRRTGGLADTVVDATPENLAADSATGIVFGDATPEALAEAFARALELYREPALWRRIQRAGMRQDFSWERSARAYLDVYRSALRRLGTR